MPFPCADGQHHLEWLEMPRSTAFALALRLTNSSNHDVFAAAMVNLAAQGDVTATLVTDGNPLPR